MPKESAQMYAVKVTATNGRWYFMPDATANPWPPFLAAHAEFADHYTQLMRQRAGVASAETVPVRVIIEEAK